MKQKWRTDCKSYFKGELKNFSSKGSERLRESNPTKMTDCRKRRDRRKQYHKRKHGEQENKYSKHRKANMNQSMFLNQHGKANMNQSVFLNQLGKANMNQSMFSNGHTILLEDGRPVSNKRKREFSGSSAAKISPTYEFERSLNEGCSLTFLGENNFEPKLASLHCRDNRFNKPDVTMPKRHRLAIPSIDSYKKQKMDSVSNFFKEYDICSDSENEFTSDFPYTRETDNSFLETSSKTFTCSSQTSKRFRMESSLQQEYRTVDLMSNCKNNDQLQLGSKEITYYDTNKTMTKLERTILQSPRIVQLKSDILHGSKQSSVFKAKCELSKSDSFNGININVEWNSKEQERKVTEVPDVRKSKKRSRQNSESSRNTRNKSFDLESSNTETDYSSSSSSDSGSVSSGLRKRARHRSDRNSGSERVSETRSICSTDSSSSSSASRSSSSSSSSSSSASRSSSSSSSSNSASRSNSCSSSSSSSSRSNSCSSSSSSSRSNSCSSRSSETGSNVSDTSRSGSVSSGKSGSSSRSSGKGTHTSDSSSSRTCSRSSKTDCSSVSNNSLETRTSFVFDTKLKTYKNSEQSRKMSTIRHRSGSDISTIFNKESGKRSSWPNKDSNSSGNSSNSKMETRHCVLDSSSSDTDSEGKGVKILLSKINDYNKSLKIYKDSYRLHSKKDCKSFETVSENCAQDLKKFSSNEKTLNYGNEGKDEKINLSCKEKSLEWCDEFLEKYKCLAKNISKTKHSENSYNFNSFISTEKEVADKENNHSSELGNRENVPQSDKRSCATILEKLGKSYSYYIQTSSDSEIEDRERDSIGIGYQSDQNTTTHTSLFSGLLFHEHCQKDNAETDQEIQNVAASKQIIESEHSEDVENIEKESFNTNVTDEQCRNSRNSPRMKLNIKPAEFVLKHSERKNILKDTESILPRRKLCSYSSSDNELDISEEFTSKICHKDEIETKAVDEVIANCPTATKNISNNDQYLEFSTSVETLKNVEIKRKAELSNSCDNYHSQSSDLCKKSTMHDGHLVNIEKNHSRIYSFYEYSDSETDLEDEPPATRGIKESSTFVIEREKNTELDGSDKIEEYITSAQKDKRDVIVKNLTLHNAVEKYQSSNCKGDSALDDKNIHCLDNALTGLYNCYCTDSGTDLEDEGPVKTTENKSQIKAEIKQERDEIVQFINTIDENKPCSEMESDFVKSLEPLNQTQYLTENKKSFDNDTSSTTNQVAVKDTKQLEKSSLKCREVDNSCSLHDKEINTTFFHNNDQSEKQVFVKIEDISVDIVHKPEMEMKLNDVKIQNKQILQDSRSQNEDMKVSVNNVACQRSVQMERYSPVENTGSISENHKLSTIGVKLKRDLTHKNKNENEERDLCESVDIDIQQKTDFNEKQKILSQSQIENLEDIESISGTSSNAGMVLNAKLELDLKINETCVPRDSSSPNDSQYVPNSSGASLKNTESTDNGVDKRDNDVDKRDSVENISENEVYCILDTTAEEKTAKKLHTDQNNHINEMKSVTTDMSEKMEDNYSAMKSVTTDMSEKTEDNYSAMKSVTTDMSEKTEDNYSAMKSVTTDMSEKTEDNYSAMKSVTTDMSEKTEDNYNTITPELMDVILQKRASLEKDFDKDCQVFVSVCQFLLSKDPNLADPLQLCMQQCLEDLSDNFAWTFQNFIQVLVNECKSKGENG